MMPETATPSYFRRFWPFRPSIAINRIPVAFDCSFVLRGCDQSPVSLRTCSRLPLCRFAPMAAVQFDDADVAVGALRLDQTLIGRLYGPLPPLPTLRSIIGRVWKCDVSVAMVEWDLLQFVFSDSATADRIVRTPSWIFEKFIIHVRRWATPTAELAAGLARVPLVAQFWGIPYACCTEELDSLLGASLGGTGQASIHRSSSSGGLYIRAKVAIDLLSPLPYEVSASHVDPSKGSFLAQVKFESIPQFCFLCGIIGHVSRLCPQKDDLARAPPRYGKHLIAKEFGPRVHAMTLARRRKRFVWTLAGNTSAGCSEGSSGADSGHLAALPSGRNSAQQQMAAHLQLLQIADAD
ncbi:unnamed protein product [Linum trigynum]|uniref:CCHC-type domain-containing protein n=1 Tax=Linum trigynum TaxID=586398 RepID=A0AAV2CY49_9ROSI